MAVAEAVREAEILVDRGLLERLRREGMNLIVDLKLKFSCLIAKRFSARVSVSEPEGDYIEFEREGVRVFVNFRTVGSRFCGGDRVFEEFEMPVKDPLKFFPKWIEVRGDLTGDFGYI